MLGSEMTETTNVNGGIKYRKRTMRQKKLTALKVIFNTQHIAKITNE